MLYKLYIDIKINWKPTEYSITTEILSIILLHIVIMPEKYLEIAKFSPKQFWNLQNLMEVPFGRSFEGKP